jgi:hypothetical protein
MGFINGQALVNENPMDISAYTYTYQVIDADGNPIDQPLTVTEYVDNLYTFNSTPNPGNSYPSPDGTFTDFLGFGNSTNDTAMYWNVQSFYINLNGNTYLLPTTIVQSAAISNGNQWNGTAFMVVP